MTLLFNTDSFEKRAAILENGKLVEFYREKSRREEVIGNIYKGKVLKVMPGLESAFIDIGLDKAAFLSVSDIRADAQADELPRIENLLKEKDELFVQVIRDPVRSKGVKLTAYISLVSCYLVLNPFVPQSSVSSKIRPKGERKRLGAILNEITPPGYGLIARTNSAGLSKDVLILSRDELIKQWEDIKKRGETANAPKLLYEEVSIIPRLLREIRQTELEEVITDDAKISQFLPIDFPTDKVTFYSGDTPIFAHYGIESETEKIFNRKIRLPSGGYIVIDQTEALTVIDVNTGRFTGTVDLENTALETNLEAAREIARILRLRDIGGIIVVDFIDMQDAENRGKVAGEMNLLLEKDRSKASVVDITPLGLMEITRKRSGGSLTSSAYEPCEYCGGKGAIKSAIAVCSDILSELKAEGAKTNGGGFVIETSPAVSAILNGDAKEALASIAERYALNVDIITRAAFRKDSYLLSHRTFLKEG
ncbi:MAG: Rne/Rng family ribonuclease [Deferribacteraceae bacterium]|jgi:ribonuclease G|nr:Rne/Rng family ribonuclease [Deferribacteraceae bacterium]